MKKEKKRVIQQPQPFTPGITRAMVREHAYRLFRDKLAHDALTLQDWVMTKKTSSSSCKQAHSSSKRT